MARHLLHPILRPKPSILRFFAKPVPIFVIIAMLPPPEVI